MATRTSFKNTSSRCSYHYETISCRFALKMCCNCRGIKLVCLGWKRRERTENSSPCANVLHGTLNLVISRRHLGDDEKEMYQNVKRTCRACRAIVFSHKTYCFVASSLLSASSFRKLSISNGDRKT